MRIRLAVAMLVACFVTGAVPTIAGAQLHDGHDRVVLRTAL
jgi:hypothetical protein